MSFFVGPAFGNALRLLELFFSADKTMILGRFAWLDSFLAAYNSRAAWEKLKKNSSFACRSFSRKSW
jgi:hypothetical protein